MIKAGRTACELEIKAAAARPPKIQRTPSPCGEAMAMLVRRGLRPQTTSPDVPFPADIPDEIADRLSERLRHYAFRLFLRGAIQHPDGFSPEQATRYLRRAQAKECADFLTGLGLAERVSRGCYRLIRPARSFGGTLEWYVARELRRRYEFDVATGVKCHVRGVGGDLDVVAAGEGRLLYLELKSSPPKNLAVSEVSAFFERVRMLRPDLALFVVDTALRLTDKVLPMLLAELERRAGRRKTAPQRISRQLWSLTPRLFAVNGHPDLVSNIGRAVAEGLLALHSPLL
jgi:hypothetical protein